MFAMRVKVSRESENGPYIAKLLPPLNGERTPNADGQLPSDFSLILAEQLPEAVKESRNVPTNTDEKAPIEDLHPTSDALCDFLFGPPQQRNALFAHWAKCWQAAREAEEEVRLVFELDEQDSALVQAPWELMRDSDRNLYLAAFQTPSPSFARACWSPDELIAAQPVEARRGEPLRVLLVDAFTSDDSEKLGGWEELLRIDRALLPQPLLQVDLRVLSRPQWETLAKWCSEWKPAVLHFIGHGRDQEGSGPVLLLNQDPENPEMEPTEFDITPAQLANQFQVACPSLVVLNACRSSASGGGREANIAASIAASIAAQSFARTLMKQGVPHVIAMQANINGQAAARLMGTFYEAIAAGAAIDQALLRARLAEKARAEDGWDWAMPTLHVSPNQPIAKLLAPPAEAPTPAVVTLLEKQKEDARTGLAWPQVLQVRVGYEDRLLQLEQRLLGPNAPAPLTVLLGETGSGKTTLLYWLNVWGASSSTRAYLYADLQSAGPAPDEWAVLRCIRDGYYYHPDVGAPAKESALRFNRFNHGLNRRAKLGYRVAVPDEQTPVPDEVGPDVRAALQSSGSGEDALHELSTLFWEELERQAAGGTLLLCLDHVDALGDSAVKFLRERLLERVLPNNEQTSPVHIVVALREWKGEWNELRRAARIQPHLKSIDLEGEPIRQLEWVARLWAFRFFRRGVVKHQEQVEEVLTRVQQGLRLAEREQQVTALLEEVCSTVVTSLKQEGTSNVLPEEFVQEFLKRRTLRRLMEGLP